MEKTKTKMKLWKKITIIAMSVVLALCVVLGGFVIFMRAPVNAYYSASEKAFRIPGLNKGVVPQGFDYDSDNGYFLISGYMKNGAPSPLYLVEKNSGKTVKRVTFLTDEEVSYTGHFGGVARYKDFLYVTNGKSLLVYSYKAVLSADDGAEIPCLGKVKTSVSDKDYVNNSFVTVYNNTLIAGEFYNGKEYTTLKSHKLTTKAGNENHAIALEYKLDKDYNLGIDPVPTKAYSLPDKVQGLLVYSNKIYLSTSYGLKFSYVLEYNKSSLTEEKYAKFLNTLIPVYSLDTSSLKNEYKLPPMSEEMVMIDNELYVMNESASSKYVFGKFIGGKWCYKTNLTEMQG